MAEGPWDDFKPKEISIDNEKPWLSFPKPPTTEEVPKQKLRANLQGWTLGFADEIEALVRSSVSSKSYEEIRDEIRGKLDAYRKQNPKEALSMELLGALVPTAVAYLTPWPGDEAAASFHLAGVSSKILKRGAVEGSVAGYATGEEGMAEDLTRVIPGAAVGTVFSGLTTLALKPAGYLFNAVMTKAREKLGDQGAGQVADKLRELAASTGKSEDDLLKAIANGEILADDPALHNILTALNNDLKVTTTVDDVLINRAKTKSDNAVETMQESLTPSTTKAQDNVYEGYIRSDKKAQSYTEDLYTDVWKDTPGINGEISDALKDAVAKQPNLTKALDEIYKLKKMKPLLRIIKTGKNKGKVKFNRDPTLEDAEIIRRTIKEAQNDAFDGKRYMASRLLQELEENLKTKLDNFSDPLRVAREEAAIVFKSREAFKIGRTILGKDADEVAVILQDLMSGGIDRSNAEAIKALRAGVMTAIRDKVRKSPTFFNKASKEGEQLNEIFRRVFPDKNIDDVINKVKLAAKTKNTKDKVLSGSQTSGRETAKLDAGTVASAASGNPSAMANIGFKLIGDLDPQLTAKQKNKLVTLLMSEDPDLIRKALIDPSWMAKIQAFINRAGTGMLKGSLKGINLEGANVAGNETEKMLNTLRR
jgi:hypothetical protein